jgi:hypothetical protein
MTSTSHRLRIAAAKTILLSVAAPACGTAQREAKVEPLPNVSAFSIQAVAGKTVGVLPITLVVADPAIQSDSVYASYRDRRLALSRADSLISEALVTRGPEVGWVLPPELRKIARRSAGFVPDPDQMGQALLRSPKVTTIPDPLRSSLRSLLAIADSRLAFVPASLSFSPEADGMIRADLPVVLADVRIGRVLWRSLALGRGRTPDDALNAALASVLPVSGGQ